MGNPWEEISLSDYENHMRLDSVRQLQSLNRTMKIQLEKFSVSSAMIFGIAGGNGLEHVDKNKYTKVYGVDINETYLRTVEDRYKELSGILQCLKIDIINEADRLPGVDLVIANLLIEYVGYEAFAEAIRKVSPRYVSCVIQINDMSVKQWVSDSPYVHSFDSLESVHHQMDEEELTAVMKNIGYKLIEKSADNLPNGKSLVRLDYVGKED